jgi:phage-related protein
MANEVDLTFRGNTADLEQSFDRVGGSARKMSDGVQESSEGFKKAGEAADEVDTKAMGFRDTLTGVQDTMGGLALLSKGPSFEGFLTLGAGIGDLGSGMYNFLIPALEKTKLGTLASAAANKVAAGASKAWAAAQWLMNSALFASPITWIVVGIVALIAVIVLIATKTDWFQRAWRNAWKWIKDAASNTWDFLKKIPGWISGAFSKVANYIMAPYKAAFNGIANAWNNTVGSLSWTVPSWVPFVGGNSISVPHLPTFHAGGTVPGVVGENVLAVLQAGETVQSIAGGGGAGGGLVLGSDGSNLGNVLVELLAVTMRRNFSSDPAALGLKIRTA